MTKGGQGVYVMRKCVWRIVITMVIVRMEPVCVDQGIQVQCVMCRSVLTSVLTMVHARGANVIVL